MIPNPAADEVPVSGAPLSAFEAVQVEHMRLVLMCGIHVASLAQQATRPARRLTVWGAGRRGAPALRGTDAAPWG